MNIEIIRDYCISKSGVTEGFPFNETALVFKVADKMFALLDLSDNSRGITLKCDPDFALTLREQHPAITPAFHFNKKHWNSVQLNGDVKDNLVKKLIDHSYELVYNKLSSTIRNSI